VQLGKIGVNDNSLVAGVPEIQDGRSNGSRRKKKKKIFKIKRSNIIAPQ
jgi:hypothetical protein